MAQDNCQKIKLLKIMEILNRETDEDHPLRTGEICERLRKMNITCDPRTLHKDMKLLNEWGYEVMSYLVNHEKGYYIADRSFSIPELKILIDAVQASGFITRKKSDELIDKIAALGGGNRAEILKENLVYFNTRKHSNEKVLYVIDSLEGAISQYKKVIFRYYDLDEKGEKVYRREGHHYVIEPLSLVFNEDNYYLVGYSSRHGQLTNYRLDRMDDVKAIDDEITDEARKLRENVGNYTESAFKMFNGEEKKVTLSFDRKLIGVVYDKFGEKTKMKKVDENTVECSVKIRISPPFFAWVFQFAGSMKIISPPLVAEEFEKMKKK